MPERDVNTYPRWPAESPHGLDAIATELYGLAPADFTNIRDSRAAEAKRAGDRELAGPSASSGGRALARGWQTS